MAFVKNWKPDSKFRQWVNDRQSWLREHPEACPSKKPYGLAYVPTKLGFLRISFYKVNKPIPLIQAKPKREVEPPPARATSKRRGGTGARVYHKSISHRTLKLLTIFEGGKLVILGKEKSEDQPENEHEKKGKGEVPRRGEVKDFSRKSRQRLQRKMATINEDETGGLPDFLTLTYPGEYSQDWKRWKRDLDAFIKAIVRKWPEVWGIWRLEFQKRGAPHFHCLLWDGPGMEGLEVQDNNGRKIIIADHKNAHNQEVYSWMSETWFRIVGSEDTKHLLAGTRIEPIQTWNGVRYYTSKYLAKLPEGDFCPVPYTGRFWGVIQAAKWKVTAFNERVSDTTFYRIRRVLRKRLERITGRRSRWGKGSTAGMTTFLDSKDSYRLLGWARSLIETPF
jgi:hypothetical protein